MSGRRETPGRPEHRALESGKSRRTLPLTRRAVTLPRRHLETQPPGKVVPIGGPDFATRDGEALSQPTTRPRESGK